jgi:hypothetical protein
MAKSAGLADADLGIDPVVGDASRIVESLLVMRVPEPINVK